jgi:hypothetical protein
LFPDPPRIHQREDIPPKPPIIWKPLSCNEVKRAIKTSNPNKTLGPDALNFLCIQATYKANPNIFNTLLQQLANNGYHPSIWQTLTMANIRQPNTYDYQHPEAYRPIALIECLSYIDDIGRIVSGKSQQRKAEHLNQVAKTVFN